MNSASSITTLVNIWLSPPLPLRAGSVSLSVPVCVCVLSDRQAVRAHSAPGTEQAPTQSSLFRIGNSENPSLTNAVLFAIPLAEMITELIDTTVLLNVVPVPPLIPGFDTHPCLRAVLSYCQ